MRFKYYSYVCKTKSQNRVLVTRKSHKLVICRFDSCFCYKTGQAKSEQLQQGFQSLNSLKLNKMKNIMRHTQITIECQGGQSTGKVVSDIIVI